ncbi:alpha-glucan water dikinase [Cymbomonas tetramitiformis]|uniref:Alpha-glucan water dikinase n=1 Tax=Cymbomonas tetramitiformis TaxID=36881 RepID=A0AAE0GHW8_9CHLO|nr:alpha-glucan water dikinase [Cymbomonas tetramitiformis]
MQAFPVFKSTVKSIATRRYLCQPACAEAAFAVEGQQQTHRLQGGAILYISESDLTVTIRCEPPENCPGSWQMPPLKLHWGMIVEGSQVWEIPSQEDWPSGTIRHKKSALRTPLIAENPSAPNGGAATLHFQLPARSDLREIRFAIFDTKNNHWHKDGKEDFVLDVSRGAPKNAVPDELVRVYSYLRWEQAGKPELTASQQSQEFLAAHSEILLKLQSGKSCASLMTEVGLDPPAPPQLKRQPAPIKQASSTRLRPTKE